MLQKYSNDWFVQVFCTCADEVEAYVPREGYFSEDVQRQYLCTSSKIMHMSAFLPFQTEV